MKIYYGQPKYLIVLQAICGIVLLVMMCGSTPTFDCIAVSVMFLFGIPFLIYKTSDYKASLLAQRGMPGFCVHCGYYLNAKATGLCPNCCKPITPPAD